MKRKIIPVLVIIALIIVTVLAYFAYVPKTKEKSNEERITETEIFGVQGNSIALMYNSVLQESTGLMDNGKIYIPYNWASVIADMTAFYIDEKEDSLLYTLPEEVKELTDVLIRKNGKYYIELNFIRDFSDVSINAVTGGEVKRILFDSDVNDYRIAVSNSETQLREGDGVSYRIIDDINIGDTVRILEDSSTGTKDEKDKDIWMRVRTDSGLIGYVRKKEMGSFDTRTVIKSEIKKTEYPSIHYDFPILLAWHQTTSQTSNKYVGDVLKHTSGINVISPTWFSLSGNEGDFTSIASHDYVKYCHDKGILVWGLIDNFTNEADTKAVLSNREYRRKLIQGLVGKTMEYGLDGINVDFEQMQPEVSEDYAQFIRELSVICRLNGIVLSVDDPNPAPYNLFYRRDVQGRYVDYVVNMGYDEHYAGGEAGSVSSYGWFFQGIVDNLNEVPKEKLIGGIPFYSRVWTITGDETTSKAYGLDAIKSEAKGMSLTWDENAGQYYGETLEGATRTKIWIEDEESLKVKADLIKSQNLAGIACWKLGLDNKEIWNVIKY